MNAVNHIPLARHLMLARSTVVLSACSFIGIFLGLLLASLPVKADWINLTGAETSPNIAEIYVQDEGIKLVLEIYINDIKATDELIPDDWLKTTHIERRDLNERLQNFSEKKFQIVTGDGEKLTAELLIVEPRMRKDRQSLFAGAINPYTRQRIPEPPEDKRVLYAELFYPFTEKPETLTITPPLDEEGRAMIGIGFIAYHKSVPIIDFRYLGAPARVDLDWSDPWYTKFDNPNLKRHHKSAMMSYLYVEPYEVRHEVLTRVKDLEEWMDLGIRGDEYIEVDELEGLKQRVGEFFLTRNPVHIDGKALKPILDRTNYVKVGLRGIQLLENPERLEISTTIVGVIITYITDAIPQHATVDWELFTDQVQQIPATAIDPVGPLQSFVTPDDNQLVWTNFLKKYELPTVTEAAISDTLEPIKIPVGTLVIILVLLLVSWRLKQHQSAGNPVINHAILAGALVIAAIAAYPFTQASFSRPAVIAGELSDEQSNALLQTLLKNVYRAFDFREENDVYDKLALSVDGDLLADIYLQNRKAFAVQQAGGAQAKIKEVEILSAATEKLEGSTLGYRIHGKWSAMGTVGHWGHLHQRKNLYDAIVTVEASQGTWKITGLELLEEQRIDPNTQKPLSNQEKTVATPDGK